MPDAFDQFDRDNLDRLELTAMSQSEAGEVAAWRYPGIYAFYDFRSDPEDEGELLDPGHREGVYFSAQIRDLGLIGFTELKPLHDGELEIGLGLRPQCTGRGLGGEYVSRVCDWAVERTSPHLLVLHVAAFNQRAICVYTRVGFCPVSAEIIDSYGTPTEFLRMERSPHPI
jgi:ribosomal-protein-alanine N-acetyltransferase